MSNRTPMETAYLKGEAYFASVHYPNTKFEKKFVLQLALEGDELAKAQKLNMNIKSPSKYVPKPHVEVKRIVRGPQTKDPEVIDGMNNPIPKDVMIGNGTVVKVKVGLYDNRKNKMAAYMDTIKVIKLVKFEPSVQEDAEFMAVEDGSNGAIAGIEVESEDDLPFEPTKKPALKAKVTTTG